MARKNTVKGEVPINLIPPTVNPDPDPRDGQKEPIVDASPAGAEPEPIASEPDQAVNEPAPEVLRARRYIEKRRAK